MRPEDDDAWLEGDGDLIFDKHALARCTGLSLKQIEHATRDGMPVHGKQRRGAPTRFRLPDVVQWLVTQSTDPLTSAKIAQAKAVARKREIEVAQLESRFADIDEVTKANADHVAKLQSDLLAIPARLAVSAEIQKLVRDGIVEAINRLAE